jgi:hypothetical protein
VKRIAEYNSIRMQEHKILGPRTTDASSSSFPLAPSSSCSFSLSTKSPTLMAVVSPSGDTGVSSTSSCPVDSKIVAAWPEWLTPGVEVVTAIGL